jgi:hypothetical protein
MVRDAGMALGEEAGREGRVVGHEQRFLGETEALPGVGGGFNARAESGEGGEGHRDRYG